MFLTTENINYPDIVVHAYNHSWRIGAEESGVQGNIQLYEFEVSRDYTRLKTGTAERKKMHKSLLKQTEPQSTLK